MCRAGRGAIVFPKTAADSSQRAKNERVERDSHGVDISGKKQMVERFS